MRFPLEKDPLHAVASLVEPAVLGPAHASASARRTGMSWIDALPLTRLVDGDRDAVVEWATDSATALSGADRSDARVRLLARAIAGERTRQALYGRLLDECVAKRDAKSAETIDRVLTSTVKRLTMLLAEHRLACGQGQRQTIVAVAHADEVYVDAGE